MLSPCIPCDIEALVDFEKNLDGLAPAVIDGFLCTFNDTCSTNVEYSEYSNELLFRFLQKDPEAFLRALAYRTSEAKKIIVLRQLSEPGSDAFEIPVLIELVEGIENEELSPIKREVVVTLKDANRVTSGQSEY